VGRAAMPRAGLTAVGRAAMPRAGLTAVGRAAMPRGVDLNLDEFDLSTTQVTTKGEVESLEACLPIGSAFWSNIFSESGSVFKEEDKNLLMAIFNPRLCDRQEEGDRFVPPDTGIEYVQKLRSLAKEEEAMRQRRMNFFFSDQFIMDEPGELYPANWKSAFEIAQGAAPAKCGLLQARPDYKTEAAAFEHVLKTATPVFDRSSEDGIKFRIYKFGSLEVRTTQKPQGKETIGVVFSICAPIMAGNQDRKLDENEKVVKATEYVEKACKGHHTYVMLETEQGNVIVSEALENGTSSWEANPMDLEDRNSLAKVLRCADCSSASFTIREIQDGSVTWQHMSTAGKKHAQTAQVMLD